MEAGNKKTVTELIDGVLPCIAAKQYSESYIQGFKFVFNRLAAYCKEHNEEYFSTELGQQFLSDCYGIQPGTILTKFSRQHRAMDLLSDFQHFGTVMIRRRLNRSFPVGLGDAAEGYLKRMELLGRRNNTILSHKKSFSDLRIFWTVLKFQDTIY